MKAVLTKPSAVLQEIRTKPSTATGKVVGGAIVGVFFLAAMAGGLVLSVLLGIAVVGGALTMLGVALGSRLTRMFRQA